MKQRLRDMAEKLIRIAAERATRKAPSMTPPDGAWDEFRARFPYEETDDQLAAIDAVLEDLGSGRPMDGWSAATSASARPRSRCAPPS